MNEADTIRRAFPHLASIERDEPDAVLRASMLAAGYNALRDYALMLAERSDRFVATGRFEPSAEVIAQCYAEHPVECFENCCLPQPPTQEPTHEPETRTATP